jgi:hypothetical protein
MNFAMNVYEIVLFILILFQGLNNVRCVEPRANNKGCFFSVKKYGDQRTSTTLGLLGQTD